MMASLLLVEDSKAIRQEILQILKAQGDFGAIHEAENGIEALKILSTEKVDLILSDVVMPKMDGHKLLMSLQNHSEWSHIPVILLTSKGEMEDRVRGLEMGAWDYLVKPADPAELLSRTRAMLRIKSLQDKLKSRIRQLERLSIVDGLTGLYNKKYLYEYIKRETKRARRYGMMLSCIMLDVDHFKKINDGYGHPAGDAILKQLAAILSDMIRGYDFAARYGGDEFTIVMLQKSDRTEARNVAERVRQAVEANEFAYKGRSGPILMRVTVSLGVATFLKKDVTNPESLIEHADEALYQAKLQGRNCIVCV